MRKGSTLEERQRWTEKKLAPWAIASLVLTVVQLTFSLTLVGVGPEYNTWITWVPLGLGLLVIATARWKYLMLRSVEAKGWGVKAVLWSFLLLQGLLFSWSSFGLVARTTADIHNRMLVQNEPMTTEHYPIEEAVMSGTGRGLRHRLTFKRDGRRETVYPGYVKELSTQRFHPPFEIILHTVPGILGTAVVLDYSWERIDQRPN